MKTFHAKKTDFTREWVLVDAKDIPLGRLASQVAARLRGKHRPIFTPNVDCGDFVVIINADKIKLTARNMMTNFITGIPDIRVESNPKPMVSCWKTTRTRWCR